jgi:hypothetical protein
MGESGQLQREVGSRGGEWRREQGWGSLRQLSTADKVSTRLMGLLKSPTGDPILRGHLASVMKACHMYTWDFLDETHRFVALTWSGLQEASHALSVHWEDSVPAWRSRGTGGCGWLSRLEHMAPNVCVTACAWVCVYGGVLHFLIYHFLGNVLPRSLVWLCVTMHVCWLTVCDCVWLCVCVQEVISHFLVYHLPRNVPPGHGWHSPP